MMKRLTQIIACLFVAFPASAENQMSAEFNVRWAGFHIMDLDVDAAWSDKSYTLNSFMKTRGIMKLFANGKSWLVAEGNLAPDGKVKSTMFKSSGRWSGNDYLREITFDDKGRLLSTYAEWPKKWSSDGSRQSVPYLLRTGPDPFSLVMSLVKQPITFAATPEKSREHYYRYRSFDGRSVTDVILACDKMDVIKKTKRSPYAGESLRCRTGVETIAGFYIETEKQKKRREKEERKAQKRAERMKKKGKEAEKESAEDGFLIWFQPFDLDDGTQVLLPVRAQMQTGYGNAMIYMKSLDFHDGSIEKAPLVASAK